MAIWLEHKVCSCDPQTYESRGAVRYDGYTYCQFCRGRLSAGDPRAVVAVDGGSGFVQQYIPVTTLDAIPGYEIQEVLGLVHGVGNVALSVASTSVAFTTAGKAERAMAKAEDDLRADAQLLGADAVVGVTVSATSSGVSALNRAHTLQLVGTAVRLVRVESPTEPGE